MLFWEYFMKSISVGSKIDKVFLIIFIEKDSILRCFLWDVYVDTKFVELTWVLLNFVFEVIDSILFRLFFVRKDVEKG